jgi:hypothetical protein
VKNKVFVVTRTLASFLEEGTIVRVVEILEDSVVIEKADTEGLLTTIQISALMTRHLYEVYEE